MRTFSLISLAVIINSLAATLVEDNTLVVRKRSYELDFTDYCKPVQIPAQVACNKAKDIGSYVQNILSQSEDTIKNILKGLGLAFCIVDKTPILNATLEQVCQVYGLKDSIINTFKIENLSIDQFDQTITALNQLKTQYKENSIISQFVDEIIAYINSRQAELKALEDQNSLIKFQEVTPQTTTA